MQSTSSRRQSDACSERSVKYGANLLNLGYHSLFAGAYLAQYSLYHSRRRAGLRLFQADSAVGVLYGFDKMEHLMCNTEITPATFM